MKSGTEEERKREINYFAKEKKKLINILLNEIK
jgi:hypothetical protein